MSRRLTLLLAACAVAGGASLVVGHSTAHAVGNCPFLPGPDNTVVGTTAGKGSSVARFSNGSFADCVDFEGTGNVATLNNSVFDEMIFGPSAGGNVAHLTNTSGATASFTGSGNVLFANNVEGLRGPACGWAIPPPECASITIGGSGDVVTLLGSLDNIDVTGSGDVILIDSTFEGQGTPFNPIVISGSGEVIRCSGTTCTHL